MNKEQIDTAIEETQHKNIDNCINQYILSFKKYVNETNDITEKHKKKNDIISFVCHMNIKSRISDENKKIYLNMIDNILPPIKSKYVF